MAKRSELKMGQERELKPISDARDVSRERPKVKILALDLAMEVYKSSGYGYDLHEDMALIQMLSAPTGWSSTSWSKQISRERALVRRNDEGKLVGQKNPDATFRSRQWAVEPLPEGRLLVKPKLLGPIWDQETKDQEKARRQDHERRNDLYKAAVEAQRKELDKELEMAGVPSTRWHGREYHLTYNDLANLINQLLQNEAMPLVHHQDFFKDQG